MILLVKLVIIGFVVNQAFNGNFDQFLEQLRQQPLRLSGIFLLLFVVGSIFLFPISVITMSVGFSFTHIWGFVKGGIYSVVFSYVCVNIAFTTCFVLGRNLFGDFIY